MPDAPLTSCIIALGGDDSHLEDAIKSVLAQTYEFWELVLVDHGPAGGSREIALRYAERDERIRYIRFAGGQAGRASSPRRFGVELSEGAYVAFLEAKDEWLPQKLEEQVAILDAHAEAAMVYGSPLYWHSWTGREQDEFLDYRCELGVKPNGIVYPPALLPLLINDQYQTAALSDALIRAGKWREISSSGPDSCEMHEDALQLARIMQAHPVYVSAASWTKCRQASRTSRGSAEGKRDAAARRGFLRCLDASLRQAGFTDSSVWTALEGQLINYDFERVRKAIRRHSPELTVEEISFLGEGRNNWAYRINDTYIFRFPKHQAAARSLGLEISLLPRLRALLPLPVPAFEFIGEVPELPAAMPRRSVRRILNRALARATSRIAPVSSHGAPRPQVNTDAYVGYQEIPGSLLYPEILVRLPHDGRESLARQLGEFLRSLHAYPASAARRAGATERRFDATYYDSALAVTHEMILAHLSQEDKRVIQELFSRTLESYDPNRYEPVLLHGDLNWSHVIFDEHRTRIAGIIDFGCMFVGDPAYDFIELWRKFDSKFLEDVLRHYGAADPEQFLLRVACLYCSESLHLPLRKSAAHRTDPAEDDLKLFRAVVARLRR
jgi:aminoglycoside phosphotransferase (APT) family kinase protein